MGKTGIKVTCVQPYTVNTGLVWYPKVSQSTGLYRHSLVFQRLENFLAQMPLKKFKWPEPFVYQSALVIICLFVL